MPLQKEVKYLEEVKSIDIGDEIDSIVCSDMVEL